MDRPAEQPGVLQHHSQSRAQFGAGDRGDVEAVEGDGPAVDLVEPHEQVDQRRLASTGGSDYRHRLARLGDQREVGDERFVGAVGEAHVVEDDTSLGGRETAVGVCGHFVGVEDLEDALGRGHS